MQRKRLKLHRTTLRQLSVRHMTRVAGGTDWLASDPRIRCVSAFDCDPSVEGCSTRCEPEWSDYCTFDCSIDRCW